MRYCVVVTVVVAFICTVTGCSGGATAPSTTTIVVTSVTETKVETSTTVATSTIVVAPLPTSRTNTSAASADGRGFTTGYARCDSGDVAVAILITTAHDGGSRVVICRSGVVLYYRGERSGRGITIREVFNTPHDQYVATTSDNYAYVVQSGGLTISRDNVVIAEEPAVMWAQRN